MKKLTTYKKTLRILKHKHRKGFLKSVCHWEKMTGSSRWKAAFVIDYDNMAVSFWGG